MFADEERPKRGAWQMKDQPTQTKLSNRNQTNPNKQERSKIEQPKAWHTDALDLVYHQSFQRTSILDLLKNARKKYKKKNYRKVFQKGKKTSASDQKAASWTLFLRFPRSFLTDDPRLGLPAKKSKESEESQRKTRTELPQAPLGRFF